MFNAIVAIREDRIDPDGGLPLGFTIRGIRSTDTCACLSTDIQNKLCSFSKRGQSTESIIFFFADAKSYIPSRE